MSILESTRWTTPSSYCGFNPIDDFVLYTKNRDSDSIELSNYDEFIATVKNELKVNIGGVLSNKQVDLEPGAYVYEWRAGHSACGWVDYLMLSKDAPENVKQIFLSMLEALEDHPVLNEDDLSEREWNNANYTWANCYNVRERAELIKKYSNPAYVSIFAARRDYIPEGDCGALFDAMEPWV